MQRAKQISESIELGIILALAGGFMDVYSYIGRDHVFANAQTGNIVFLSTALFQKDWPNVVRAIGHLRGATSSLWCRLPWALCLPTWCMSGLAA